MLASLARERQDLVAEWQQRDGARTAAASEAPDKRNAQAEADNSARIDAIDARLAVIDKRLAADFPNYAALVRPEPLSIADTQAQLGANEALVLFLNTNEVKPIPEETFIWVVTKTDSRLVRSELGPNALAEHVAALRCGLDATLWQDAADWPETTQELLRQKETQIARRQRCETLVKAGPSTQLVGLTRTEVLPFDATRAHALYKALFSGVEDLIRGKHLLVALDGALTSLPLSVLVTAPPKERIPSGLADYRADSVARNAPAGHGVAVGCLAQGPARDRTGEPRQARAARRRQSPARWARGRPAMRVSLRPPATSRPAPRNRPASSWPRATPSWARSNPCFAARRPTSNRCGNGRRCRRRPTSCARSAPAARSRERHPAGRKARERTLKELSEQGRLADYQILHFATHGALAGE